MMILARKYQTAREHERGFVLVVMAAATIAMIASLGLAVDIGRMFITKNETQAFCDSAALAAALALDGTTSGIANARDAVSASKNSWNMATTQVSNPAVTFATAAAGPWVSSPNPATGYLYVRVSANVPMQLYFLPVVGPSLIQNVASSATAGQFPITSFSTGLAPYTAVSTDPVGPNFGLVTGNAYDIQWPQFNGSRAGCSESNPDKCFNSAACSGETQASKAAVVANWGANTSGYWGSTSNNMIQKQILDLIQLQAVAVGTNIFPVLSNGQKQSEAGYLDERASQDINGTDNDVAAYLSNPHNGRRLIPAPIVNPVDPTHTNVIGYGLFLLYTNGASSNYYTRTTNGNDPFCAIYAGPYNVGSTGIGTGGATGASWVKLVL
ncbi:MAG: hypothetical protein HYZ37_18025 [Candidatus Solibacter usitatus]|nr:hypothetical protein [Candidatus Solibacter usitatus]